MLPKNSQKPYSAPLGQKLKYKISERQLDRLRRKAHQVSKCESVLQQRLVPADRWERAASVPGPFLFASVGSRPLPVPCAEPWDSRAWTSAVLVCASFLSDVCSRAPCASLKKMY